MRLAIFIFIISIISCKEDKTPAASDVKEVISIDHVPDQEGLAMSNELYAALDRLRIRSDSSMNANTVVTISEKDTLIYLDSFSQSRLAMKLRGEYYYEPWLKVKHQKTSKTGWVYGGAVRYDSKALKDHIRDQSPVMEQIYADDLEWEGTVPTSWKTATISNAESFKIFLINFKEMVKHDEINKIADLIRFPIKNIENRQQFKENYTRIFSDEMKAAVSTQRLDRIFRNSGGASIGDGEIWFHQIGEQFKIVAINFKGREDLKEELMQRLASSYHANNRSAKLSIKAFKIRDFLELTLIHQGLGGAGQTKSLGKYVYESTMNGMHSFHQDTQDSLKRRLVFSESTGLMTLQVLDSTEPNLDDLSFVVGN